jgi:hypothetical protein
MLNGRIGDDELADREDVCFSALPIGWNSRSRLQIYSIRKAEEARLSCLVAI